MISLIIILSLQLILVNPRFSNAKTNFDHRYAKTTVNIRAAPNMQSKIVGQCYWNDKIRIIRKVNKKWYLIRYQKKNRFICGDYLRKNPYHFKSYSSPGSNVFKSYEDADCITDSIKSAQGRLKQKYHLDLKTGVYMVGNRYCVAVGSYYTEHIGVKIDLILLSRNGRKHTLKCITADSKADKDTIKNHKVHKDGSVVEFVVRTRTLPVKTWLMGDISYAGKQFKGKIVKIKVYQ